ncbi:MAG: tetratricopeptide repeat protein [Elusimicrobia bacterium]|nr:tetratricopeptide repeat protein [Elusimicrobiota bacterium]
MKKTDRRPAEQDKPAGLVFSLAWAALLVALVLVPDQKILRFKLLAVELGAAALLLGLLVEAASIREALWRRTKLDLWLAAYALSALIFWRLSPEPHNSEPEVARMLLCAAAFFGASQSFARVRKGERLLALWSACAAVAALYAILQHTGGVGRLLVPQMERPFSTFGNPIFFGAYLTASLLVTAVLLIESQPGLSAMGLLLCAALQLDALWLAQSRAAFAGLIAGGFLWALKRQSGTRRTMMLLGVAVFGLGILWHSRDRQWTHGLIWSAALKLWLAHPLLGCGLGRFHMEFPAYASAQLKALWPQQQTIVNFAHNEYLQVLTETGAVGLALFVAIPASFASWFLGAQATGQAEGPALAALALFAGAFFSPDLRFGVSSFAAFAAMGMALGLSNPEPRPWPDYPKRMVPLALGVILLSFWARLAAAPLLAERELASQPGFHIEATPEVRKALADLEDRLSKEPANADLAEQLAYLYAREKAWEPAISRFKLAAGLAPEHPGPLNNLGNIYYSLGDFDKAISFWEKSLAVKSDQLDAHLNLGKLYYERGRLKESARHLHAALTLDPDNGKARILLKKMVE